MDMTNNSVVGSEIESLLGLANDGDEPARERLLTLANDRLMALSRKLKRGFPRVGRWEQTEDVCQMASLKLYDALAATKVNDSRHFFRLAAKKIRETLIDLARHYQGAHGVGANHATQMPASRNGTSPGSLMDNAGEMTQNPQQLAQWKELHESIGALPDDLKEMFDLLWYNELSQDDAAKIVGISTRQVKRRWRDAKLALSEAMGGDADFLG